MAILIVDDDSKTRETLRLQLHRLGHKTVIEARDGNEALRILAGNPSRFRAIISDLEMPFHDGRELLSHVAADPALSLCSFLLIPSESSPRKLRLLARAEPRLDEWLAKPFRAASLERALTRAFRRRASTRHQVILYSTAPHPELERRILTHRHWRAVTHVHTHSELAFAVAKTGGNLGAIFIEPGDATQSPDFNASWFQRFKKTPIGRATPLICLTRDPERLFPLRTHCQFFVNPPESEESGSAWSKLLDSMELKILSSWEVELLSQETKSALHRGDRDRASKYARRILKIDPTHSEAHMLLGELMELAGQTASACAHYRESIIANPCMPRPYIKLFELLESQPTLATLTSHEEYEQASLFCPRNSEILLRCGKAPC